MTSRRTLLIMLACSFLACIANAQESLWSFSAGPIILRRDNPDRTPVFVNNAGTPVCFASDFNFDYEIGLDVSIRRIISEGIAVQARYFGVNDWDASKELANQPNGLQFATNPPSGIVVPSSVSGIAVYGSSLHSTEVNALHPHQEWLNLLAGFRWIEQGEMINGATFGGGPAPDGIFYSNTNNHLYGFQVGAEALIWASERGCSLDGFAKAGIFGNSADHAAKYTGANPWWNHASRKSTSFVGEAGLTGSWNVLDWLTVRCGYEALWISGVALSSNQIPITPTTNHHGAITTGGSVFYHGGLLQVIIFL
jgi:hypothetical protein